MIKDRDISERLQWCKNGEWNQGEWRHDMAHGNATPILSRVGWLALDLDRQLSLRKALDEINDK